MPNDPSPLLPADDHGLPGGMSGSTGTSVPGSDGAVGGRSHGAGAGEESFEGGMTGSTGTSLPGIDGAVGGSSQNPSHLSAGDLVELHRNDRPLLDDPLGNALAAAVVTGGIGALYSVATRAAVSASELIVNAAASTFEAIGHATIESELHLDRFGPPADFDPANPSLPDPTFDPTTDVHHPGEYPDASISRPDATVDLFAADAITQADSIPTGDPGTGFDPSGDHDGGDVGTGFDPSSGHDGGDAGTSFDPSGDHDGGTDTGLDPSTTQQADAGAPQPVSDVPHLDAGASFDGSDGGAP